MTIEFDDYFVIAPSITFYSRKSDFTESILQEKGKIVEYGFEYNSGSNKEFLTKEEIIQYNSKRD